MQTKKYENIGETLITETLPNGLTINLLPKSGFTKSYAMFATNYGGADRRFKLAGQWIDTPAGIAHFLEHKMFDMPNGNALSILSANGASPNAFTSSGMTAYYFECTSKFEENLKTLLEFVSTAYFTAESVQKEQGIIGQEIRMVEDDPGYVVYNNLMRCLYKHNPVRDSVAGTVESIAQISDKTLYDCHKVFYNPSNMTLSVVGSIDPEFVIKTAKELLPSEGGEVSERDYGEKESDTPHTAEVRASMEVSAPQFLFGSVIKPADKGTPRLRQMLIGETALRLLIGRSSGFYTKLYADGLLNNSFEYEIDYTAGTAMLLAGGESRDVSAVMDALCAEVEAVCKNGVDLNLFENAKKGIYGAQLRSLGSFSSTAISLTDGAFSGFCPLDAFEIIGSITADEVLSFIKAQLSRERLALSVIDPVSK